MCPERDPSKPFPWTWDEILEHAVSETEYPVEIKKRLVDAVTVLRSELGELDARRGSKPDDRLWFVQLNTAPWTRFRLAWLGNCLRDLRAHHKYLKVRRLLRMPTRFPDAMDVVEVAEVCTCMAGRESPT